ncbi:MAG: PAS domain-containing protein [Chloroflexota bacterium]|nr:PAS domain-containing protein [Chloroflexota bacterium]
MPQQEIEVILARHLASYLAMPIFLVDPDGTLVFYNEPSETVLGRRFSETGPLTIGEWSTAFIPRDERGETLPPDDLPLVVALRDRCPAHSRFWIRSLDGVTHHIEVTAFPLIGEARRFLGAIAIFWDIDR